MMWRIELGNLRFIMDRKQLMDERGAPISKWQLRYSDPKKQSIVSTPVTQLFHFG